MQKNHLSACKTTPTRHLIRYVILTGDVPTKEQTESLIADWSARRERQKKWWLEGENGGIVGTVLKALPNTITLLGRISIALATLDGDRNTKRAIKNGALKYTHWEVRKP